MARGLVIPFSADLRQWGKAIRNIGKDLDDVADDFRDVERASDRSADDIERNMEDAADDIERAFSNLGREVEDEFDRMERAARDTDLDISDGVESAADSGKRAVGLLAGEVFDEFVESWGEAVRSGDYGDAIRETFSNLGQIGGAAFGPVGAVGGAVAGFFLTGVYDKLTDSASKERVAALSASLFDAAASAEDAYESGFAAAEAVRAGFIAASQQDETLVEALGVDSVQEAWAEVGRLAKETGLPVSTVTGAINGQEEAVAAVEAAIQRNKDAYSAVLDEQGRVFDTDRERFDELEAMKGPLDDQISALRTIDGASGDVREANELTAQALEAQARNDAQISAERKDQARASQQIATDTERVKNNVRNTPDLDIKANVDDSEIRNLPTRRDLFVTARVSAVGATSKAQNLLDRGII